MFSRILSWSLDEMCRIHHTTSFNYTKPHMELAFEAETTPCGIAQSLLVLLRFVKTKYIMKYLKIKVLYQWVRPIVLSCHKKLRYTFQY